MARLPASILAFSASGPVFKISSLTPPRAADGIGSVRRWDGLISWFIAICTRHPDTEGKPRFAKRESRLLGERVARDGIDQNAIPRVIPAVPGVTGALQRLSRRAFKYFMGRAIRVVPESPTLTSTDTVAHQAILRPHAHPSTTKQPNYSI